jgi:S-formylglutathione hydrolase FrmB
VYSTAMRKYVRNLVVVPQQAYQADSTTRFPVVYLLHGWSGDFTGWLGDAPQLLQSADQYGCILVFPDGGYDSWYLDSPVDTNVRYESYIIRELIPHIDRSYRTKTDATHRSICGLSMGGHGALYLALRNGGVFGAAGSMCGGVDLRPFKKNDWDLEGVLGKPNKHWDHWENASIVYLVETIGALSTPNLIIDCGVDDFFLPVNRDLHQKLMGRNIPHEYTERPGGHDAAYWGNAVDYQLLFFAKQWRP